jgi:phosphopantetheine adenylyltransferase
MILKNLFALLALKLYIAAAFSAAKVRFTRQRYDLGVCHQSKSIGDHVNFKHTLAVLTMPCSSIDRIANEAILDTAIKHSSNKLSVVLRCESSEAHSLSSLRRYVGEVYSTLWDVAMSMGDPNVLNVVVFPQNLPNAAPEQWIHHQSDLDCVCSHDSICGWVSEKAQGRGLQFQQLMGSGEGGLDAHVAAINADRAQRQMAPVKALHVEHWPVGASVELQRKYNVAFLDDEVLERQVPNMNKDNDDEGQISTFLGGARIPESSLFEKVAVGGTFDGMHYGHRKLLTLAVSSVHPVTGQLLIGVTVDEMLKHKTFAEHIPPLADRMEGVREFLYRLAPGIKNRIRIEPIADPYGPPGHPDKGVDFDALVLSHETLENGCKLNQYREETLGFKPLTLLCTRRTEPNGMSSTAMRKLRSDKAKIQ